MPVRVTNGRRPISRVKEILARAMAGDALDDRVRRKLVSSLYTQPASLALGAACGVTGAGVVAYESGNLVITGLAVLLTLVATFRIVTAIRLGPESDNRDTKRLEMIYELGAFSYASVVG